MKSEKGMFEAIFFGIVRPFLVILVLFFIFVNVIGRLYFLVDDLLYDLVIDLVESGEISLEEDDYDDLCDYIYEEVL